MASCTEPPYTPECRSLSLHSTCTETKAALLGCLLGARFYHVTVNRTKNIHETWKAVFKPKFAPSTSRANYKTLGAIRKVTLGNAATGELGMLSLSGAEPRGPGTSAAAEAGTLTTGRGVWSRARQATGTCSSTQTLSCGFMQTLHHETEPTGTCSLRPPDQPCCPCGAVMLGPQAWPSVLRPERGRVSALTRSCGTSGYLCSRCPARGVLVWH